MYKSVSERRTAFLLIILCFAFSFIIETYKSLKLFNDNPSKFLKSAPDSYTALFNHNAQKQLEFLNGTSYVHRPALVTFKYANYNIDVTKLGINGAFNMQKDISVKIGEHAKGKVADLELNTKGYGFRSFYAGYTPRILSKFHVWLNGDSIKSVMSNDSILCYYLKLKSAVIKYDNEEVNQIRLINGDGIDFFKGIEPVEIMLIKKKQWVYFIALSYKSNVDKLPIKETLLRDLVINQ